MDSNLHQLYYELELITEILEKVQIRQIWWLEEEEIVELKKRQNLLEILVKNT